MNLNLKGLFGSTTVANSTTVFKLNVHISLSIQPSHYGYHIDVSLTNSFKHEKSWHEVLMHEHDISMHEREILPPKFVWMRIISNARK